MHVCLCVLSYLEVHIPQPSVSEAGEYTCEVNAVNALGHNVQFSSTLEVQVTEPNMHDLVSGTGGPGWARNVKFGFQIGSDWPQVGQILDFFLRSVSVNFGSPSLNVLKLILKSPRFVLFGGQSDPIWMPNLTSRITVPLFSFYTYIIHHRALTSRP